MASSATERVEFTTTYPSLRSPARTSTWRISVTSWMITASGATTGSCALIGSSDSRTNDATGAPVRSDPKLGKACACMPSTKPASASSSDAVTTPCPPRP